MNGTTLFSAFALAAFTLSASAAPAEAAPITLENRHLSLRFDRQTGAWISFVDRKTGDELITGPVPRSLVAATTLPKLDPERVAGAIARGDAVSLEGEWLYTPKTPDGAAGDAFTQGRFEGANWEPTPVPSCRGVGDDRLNGRTGDFWYRREFICPASLQGDLMLVIGAVDDFDVAYVNGVCVGSTDAATPHHWEAPRYYSIPAKLLRRGEANTLLLRVTNGAYDGGIAGPVALGKPEALGDPESAGPSLQSVSRTRRGKATVLRLAARSGDYEYQMEYVLPDDRSSFTRQWFVRNITDTEQVLQTVTSATPPLLVGPGQCVLFPGSLPVGDNPVADLNVGAALSSRSQDPLAILWDGSKKRGVGAWYHCEEEYAPVAVRRIGNGAAIRHAQGITIRLKPGETVALGVQYLWLAHGTRDEALRGVQDVYRAIGLRAPKGALTGLREKVIYCGHPGGPPELNYRTYGGFKAVRAYLPTLQKLGIDLLWFLPIWEHGDGSRWNLYSPFDHFKVSPLYGTPEELKDLAAAGKTDGIRLVFDLVPHGPPDSTPLAKEHPEWVCRDENGKMRYEWGQYAFDNAHPGWQAYMRRAAEWDAREYGAVGARVDCGAGSPLNWNPAVGNRPSHSTLAGGLGMDRAIREGFLQANREVLLLPEEYTGANIFYRVSDLTYDAQLYYLMMELHARDASPEEQASAFQQFLHDQQVTLPPGALKMRWISNHDTVSWTFQKKRPLALYGPERMRALLALCALIEGVPMLYQGDEDPAVYGGKGPSSVEFLSRIYALRKRLPALRVGSADYASARAAGGIFACLRRTKGQTALVLISLNPEAVQSDIHFSSRAVTDWRDALSGERFPAPLSGVPMAPYQVRVLVAP